MFNKPAGFDYILKQKNFTLDFVSKLFKLNVSVKKLKYILIFLSLLY